MGAPRPKARVVMEPDGDSLWVAQAVARKLEDDAIARRCSSREELLARIGQIDGELAWQRLLSWLKRRDLTTNEAATRLGAEGFASASVSAAVTRAQELGFINDARYAEAFVRGKVAAGWGRRKIELELTRRGLSLDEDEEWVEELLCREAELERARDLLSRRSLKGARAREKAARFLMGRGYGTSLAWEVAREMESAGDFGD